ncbi:MAG: peptidylprolyl isomerase [Fimbriimonadaceae bacterium]|nr:peptidylprolyl isomerase [Fimbriimonadaceae bacterium]
MSPRILSTFTGFGLAALLIIGCAQPTAEPAKIESATTTAGEGGTTDAKAASLTETTTTESAPAPAEQGDKFSKLPFASTKISATDRAVIETNMGTIELSFFVDKAPNHVKNFIHLAEKGFYEKCQFHRVIKGFMIQGGCPNTKPGNAGNGPAGTGGPGYNVPAEFNDTAHEPGILSMARAGDPDSAGSQFFICHAAAPSLDGQYTAFGKVEKGMNVVNKIAEVKTGPNDMPTSPVVINKIRIVRKS